jgi:hypothetical protein
MLTYRTVLSLVLFGACGLGIGIMGRIGGFYAALAFLAFPFTVGLLSWSIMRDMRRTLRLERESAQPASPTVADRPADHSQRPRAA